jgi:mono/diheme cytochrome c family protein
MRKGVHILLLAISAAGCRYGEMWDQPRYEAYDPSEFFNDGQSSRPLEPGVVPRRDLGRSLEMATGKTASGEFIDALPKSVPLDAQLMERGQNRFRIYCAPCHGVDGAGRGTIVERGFTPPPKLYETKVREQPLGYYYDVITNGHGVMYGYAARIAMRDRWAIAAYLRALQLSQSADVAELEANDLERLRAGEAKPATAEAGHSEARP